MNHHNKPLLSEHFPRISNYSEYQHMQHAITPPRNARKQSGWTLVELLVVIFILGVLAALASPFISEGQKMGDSTAFYNTADRLATSWRLGTMKCQAPSVIGTSPITTPASAAAHLQLLVAGTGVSAAYAGCWASAKIEPLNRSNVRGIPGAYTFNGATVTIANLKQNNTNRVATTFNPVDDATVLQLVQQYGGQANASTFIALPDAADTSDMSIQFGAAGPGNRSLTIIR